MAKKSAGLLVYRRASDPAELEVLLAHPGGPFFARKDLGVWTIPKGEYDDEEEPEAAAAREFAEEIGLPPPDGPYVELGEVRQASGKRVRAFAVESDLDLTGSMSNLFEMEWPPGSGRVERFPEVDRAAWYGTKEAAWKLNASQAVFVDRLVAYLGGEAGASRARDEPE